MEQELDSKVDSPSIRVFKRTCYAARQLAADLLVRAQNLPPLAKETVHAST